MPRPLSLAEWREEVLAREVRRGRRRLTDAGGVVGWVEDRWRRWRWREKVARWEREGAAGAGMGVGGGGVVNGPSSDVDDLVGEEEVVLGELEDPRRLESLALPEMEEGVGEGLWSVGEDAEARLGFFDFESGPPQEGEGEEEGEQGDAPLRLQPGDLAVLKSFLESKAAALASSTDVPSSSVSDTSIGASAALWGRRRPEAEEDEEEDEDEEGYEYEYRYEDEVPAGEEGDYELVEEEEEERRALAAMLEQRGSGGSSNPNERFVVRGGDGRFYAPSSGRRLEELAGEEEEEAGGEGEGEETGTGTRRREWAVLESVPLQGTPGLVAAALPSAARPEADGEAEQQQAPGRSGSGGGARLAATLRRAVRGRVLAALARRIEAEHGAELRARGRPLEMVTFHLVRILRDGMAAAAAAGGQGEEEEGGIGGGAPRFHLFAAPRLLRCVIHVGGGVRCCVCILFLFF